MKKLLSIFAIVFALVIAGNLIDNDDKKYDASNYTFIDSNDEEDFSSDENFAQDSVPAIIISGESQSLDAIVQDSQENEPSEALTTDSLQPELDPEARFEKAKSDALDKYNKAIEKAKSEYNNEILLAEAEYKSATGNTNSDKDSITENENNEVDADESYTDIDTKPETSIETEDEPIPQNEVEADSESDVETEDEVVVETEAGTVSEPVADGNDTENNSDTIKEENSSESQQATEETKVDDNQKQQPITNDDTSNISESEQVTTQNTSQQQDDSEEESDGKVWIPESGKKYHKKKDCSNMKGPKKVTKEYAVSVGYTPCKKCYKNQ